MRSYTIEKIWNKFTYNKYYRIFDTVVDHAYHYKLLLYLCNFYLVQYCHDSRQTKALPLVSDFWNIMLGIFDRIV